MTDRGRRNFLKGAIAGGALLGFGGLIARNDLFRAFGEPALAADLPLYGPLFPKASNNTGEVAISLPKGFQYNIIGRAGTPMTNGQPLPTLQDGMGVFRSSSIPTSWALVRNHENQGFSGVAGSVSGPAPYDPAAGGGTTTLIVDRETRLVTASQTGISGTVWNCAGGVTPWRTWISCEETIMGPASGFTKPHGYCFEVDPLVPGEAVPIRQMGRFRHEAAAVERSTGIVYLTEDNPLAGFYRYLPDRRGDLAAGGKLQVLAVADEPGYDARVGQIVGRRLLATWIDIPDPDPASAEANPSAVFEQAPAAAKFARLEGCFAGLNQIYFTSTNGGDAGLGQVWRYESRKKSKFGYLTLVFQSPNAAVLDFPDNVCFGPGGGLYLCEDGTVDNYIRILSPNGSLSDFAQNLVPGLEGGEFTGSAFSPDQKTLFVNIQLAGMTLAIWGDW